MVDEKTNHDGNESLLLYPNLVLFGLLEKAQKKILHEEK
jgi:hypothetical protein